MLGLQGKAIYMRELKVRPRLGSYMMDFPYRGMPKAGVEGTKEEGDAIKVEPLNLMFQTKGFDAVCRRYHALGCFSGYAATFESFNRAISLRPQSFQVIRFHYARSQLPPLLPSKKV